MTPAATRMVFVVNDDDLVGMANRDDLILSRCRTEAEA